MKSLTIKDNFEIRSNIGNGYFKMAPLVRTADKQLFYPIVKFQPNICITGLELAITEDKQKLLIQNYLCCIDNTISQLEKLKKEISTELKEIEQNIKSKKGKKI